METGRAVSQIATVCVFCSELNVCLVNFEFRRAVPCTSKSVNIFDISRIGNLTI